MKPQKVPPYTGFNLFIDDNSQYSIRAVTVLALSPDMSGQIRASYTPSFNRYRTGALGIDIFGSFEEAVAGRRTFIKLKIADCQNTIKDLRDQLAADPVSPTPSQEAAT